MRICLVFLLAIMFSLNTAYAASLGICDALEHTSNHAPHFGHHSHEDSDSNASQASGDKVGKVTSASDHYHNHVHPSFSSILPDIIGVTSLMGCSVLVGTPAITFFSALQALPDYPPKAYLA